MNIFLRNWEFHTYQEYASSTTALSRLVHHCEFIMDDYGNLIRVTAWLYGQQDITLEPILF